jgi:hypothetical protein
MAIIANSSSYHSLNDDGRQAAFPRHIEACSQRWPWTSLSRNFMRQAISCVAMINRAIESGYNGQISVDCMLVCLMIIDSMP